MLAMLVLTIIVSCLEAFRTRSRVMSLSGNNAAQACIIWPSTAAIMQLCIDLQGVKDNKRRRAEERQRSILESCNPKEAVAVGSYTISLLA